MGNPHNLLTLSPCCLADVETFPGRHYGVGDTPPDPVEVCSKCNRRVKDVLMMTRQAAQAVRQPRNSKGRFRS
jgi:hypothetical protein